MLSPGGTCGYRQVIRTSKQGDSSLSIICILDIETNPTTVWQNVMRLRQTRRDQLVPDAFGKWYVHKIVTVNVSNFPSTQTILRATEAMRANCDG